MGAQTKDDNRGQWEGTAQWPGRARSRGSCGQERGQMPTAARERDRRPRLPRRGDGRLPPPSYGCPTTSPEASVSQDFLTLLSQDPQAAPAPSPTQQALLRPGLPLQPCGPIGPPRPRHGVLCLCWTWGWVSWPLWLAWRGPFHPLPSHANPGAHSGPARGHSQHEEMGVTQGGVVLRDQALW